MQAKITNVWDRSNEFKLNAGSAVQFTYVAEAAFKQNKYTKAERIRFQDRLWVDFNQGRFLFSDTPEKGEWTYCSIAGNIDNDDEIEIFPCDDDTFMCSIVLHNLNPRKFTKFRDYEPKSAKLLIRGPQGFIFNDKMAFQAVLEYRELQKVNDVHTEVLKHINQRVMDIMISQVQESLNNSVKQEIGGMVFSQYSDNRVKEAERKERLLRTKGTVLRNWDGELIDSLEETSIPDDLMKSLGI